MANIFQISQLTPVKWFRQSDIWNMQETTGDGTLNVFHPNHNTRHFDADLWQRNLTKWMDKATYLDPWQTQDRIKEQFVGVEEYLNNQYVVRVCTPQGEVIKSVNAEPGAQIGSTDQYLWKYTLPLWDVPVGRYYLQLWYIPSVGGDPNYFLISAPIEVKVYHEGTQLFRYKHSSNDQDVFFETGIEFTARYHSQLMEFQPTSMRNVYKDEPGNLTLLSGITYREWQLTFGGMEGNLPDYRIDKISRMFDCDSVYIDSKMYTATDGGKLEIERIKNSPLSGVRLQVQEMDNDPALYVPNLPEIVCCTAPTSRRFYVDSYTVPTFGATPTIRKHFNGIASFMSYLNTVIFSGFPQGTFFAINGNNEIVIQSNDDLYYAIFEGMTINNILQGWVACDVTAGLDFELDMIGTSFNYAVDYGAGAAITMVNGTNPNITNTPASNTTIYVFMADCTLITLIDSDIYCITAIDGQLPASIETFETTGLGIKEVSGDMFDRCIGDLDEVFFDGNKLGVHTVNRIIMNLVDSLQRGGLQTGGVGLDISGQSPSAVPSITAGIGTLISLLNAAGFAVNHD